MVGYLVGEVALQYRTDGCPLITNGAGFTARATPELRAELAALSNCAATSSCDVLTSRGRS